MWMVKATEDILKSLGVFHLDGDIFGHRFSKNIALVDKHYAYHFFMRRGFEDVTPSNGIMSGVNSYKTVLLIRFGGYGDALLATSLIKGFKEKNPDTTLDWLGTPNNTDLLLGNPGISRYLEIIPHELGLIYDLYDQVYDLTHSIETNSEATYTNPYDVLSKWTGIPLPKEIRPYVYLSKEELKWGENGIKEYFSFKKPIIGLAIESSAPRRTWPIDRSVFLAENLAKDGYQVILLGAYNRIGDLNNKMIINTVGRYNNLRILASLVRYCDLVIAPFTVYLHLSQAFGYKKVLVLGGPWDGGLETKYYPYKWIIQGKKDCAPCFRLGNRFDRCEKNDGGIGQCMEAISVEEVHSKVVSIMNGEKPYEFVLKAPSYRPCPCCHGDSKVFSAYGDYFYLKCFGCGSVFINESPKNTYYDFKPANEIVEKLENGNALRTLRIIDKVSESPVNNVFDIGCGNGAFLYALKKSGRNVSGIDNIVGIRHMVKEKYDIDIVENDCENWSINEYHKAKYQLITMNWVIEHLNDPFRVLLKCSEMLSNGGFVYIVTHDSNSMKGVQEVRKTSVILGGNFAGEHVVIFSQDGIRKVVEKAGFKVVDIKSYENGRMEVILNRG